MRRLTLLIAIVCCLLGASCAPGGDTGRTMGSAFRAIDPEAWLYADTLVFPLADMVDSAGCVADVAVTVRHSNDYPYSNLWLEMNTPEGDYSVSVELADVFGRWYGRGMGLTFERTDTVARALPLTPSDTLRLHHKMRLDTLTGIEQMGIFLSRHNPESR